MTMNSFLRRNFLTLAAAAGMLSVVTAGLYLKNPETLIADSYNRVLGGPQIIVQASWPAAGWLPNSPSQRAARLQRVANDFSADLQLQKPAALQTADGAFAITSAAMPGLLNIGDRITIDSSGELTATFEIISVLPLEDTITRVDTSLGSSSLMLVTARATSAGDGRVIRFTLAASAMPTLIIPTHDADQTL